MGTQGPLRRKPYQEVALALMFVLLGTFHFLFNLAAAGAISYLAVTWWRRSEFWSVLFALLALLQLATTLRKVFLPGGLF